MLASSQGNLDIVELLLAKGADVNEKSTGGRTSLEIASIKGYTKIVEILRRAGAR